MHSKTKAPLNRDQIDAVIKIRFLTAVSAVEECSDGMFNAAYRVDLDGGGPVFLKAAPTDDIQVLTYEKDILKTEAEVYRLIHQHTTIPAPELLHVDVSRDIIDRDYLITSYLSGMTWDKVGKEDQKANIETIKKELGTCLGQLHKIEGERFGYFPDLEHPAAKRWDTAFLRMVENVLADGEAIKVRLPYRYEMIRQVFADNRSYLEDVVSPRLVHYDLWAGNVFVQQNDSGYHLEGIVDCERAFFGDPYAEFVSNILLFDDVENEPAFLEGYHEGHGVPLLFDNRVRQRLNLYRAYLLLIMMIEIPYRGYGWRYRLYRPLFVRWFKKTMRALRAG